MKTPSAVAVLQVTGFALLALSLGLLAAVLGDLWVGLGVGGTIAGLALLVLARLVEPR